MTTPIEELPKLIGKEELLMLDPHGRNCEVCNSHMHYHEWALMDYEGFVIFCSNLTFRQMGKLNIVSTVHYTDESNWESPAAYSHVTSGSDPDVEVVKKRYTERFNDPNSELERVEVWTFYDTEYFGHKKSVLVLERPKEK